MSKINLARIEIPCVIGGRINKSTIRCDGWPTSHSAPPSSWHPKCLAIAGYTIVPLSALEVVLDRYVNGDTTADTISDQAIEELRKAVDKP